MSHILPSAAALGIFLLSGCAVPLASMAPDHCPRHGVPFTSRVMYRVRPDVYVFPAPEPASFERRFPRRIPWYYVPVPGEVADIPERVRYCNECERLSDRARRRNL